MENALMSIFHAPSGRFQLGSGPRVSFEVFPARSTMQADGMNELAEVMGRYDPAFVSVTYGAGGSSREATFGTISQLIGHGGFDVVGHLTCAGQTREQTDAVVERYAAQGVKGILALRGDMPGVTGPYEPHPGGYENATDLTRALARRGDFDIYVAAYPEVHPASASAGACLANLKRKLTAGADAAITQFFFDNRDYFDFMERVRAAGIHQPIIPGILLIHDFNKVASFAAKCRARIPEEYYEMFDRLPAHSAEHKEQACELAADQIVRLAAQGVDHVHIYTMNRPDLVERTCRLAGIEQSAQIMAGA
jgi:methylenetetrahydrofolate reductase (NADPH)